jgi:single-strand DNA-binding protein
MSSSYNKIVLIGNLTRDPEIRYINSGAGVTKFTLAVNRRTKQQNEVDYIDIVAWDNGNFKLAETCNTYLKKGMSVLVEGRLSIRSYETKDGEKRKATEVIINEMKMLDRRDSAASRGGNGTPSAAAHAQSDGGGTAVMERTDLDETDIENLFPEDV